MISYKDFMKKLQGDDVNYIIVEVAHNWLVNTDLEVTVEGWKEFDNVYSYRIDPEDPAIPQQRHVHIAKTADKPNKNKQVSWNIDGTRHDRGSFNISMGKRKKAKEIARSVLKLDSGITLESYTSSEESEKIRILFVE